VTTSRGIDVSTYQGPQDWAARKAAGLAFAFAKASEGQHSRDDHFVSHITGIKAAGLVPGAYHFGWPTQDPAVEAANYIAAVKPYAGPGFVHWLDLERRSDGANYKGRSAAQIRAWAAKWLALVAAAFPGQRVGIYTSGDDLAKGHVPTGTTLWYPAYPGTSVDTYAEAEARARPKPSGWTPLIWQFTSNPATGPNLDLNLCYLSPAELRTWAGGTTPEEDPMAAISKQDIYDAVWKTDQIAAPADAPDIKTNPTWAAQSYLKDIDTRIRAAQATEAAQNATIDKLVIAVATLAAHVDGLDPATIVAELKAAIESIQIHIDATP
jgi:GH25 family lysozyme M1 (1,4-beta-N-acetylmuramidase)